MKRIAIIGGGISGLTSPLLETEYDRIKVGGGTHTNKLNLGLGTCWLLLGCGPTRLSLK